MVNTHETATFCFEAPMKGAPRLLLVEDDLELARSLERGLTALGSEVILTTDGVLASEALTKSSFDVVLSDISLPGISGIELLRLVRAYDLDVPVLLMTANPSIETAVQAVELGAFQYLVKPVQLDKLAVQLERATALGRLARAKRQAILATFEAAPSSDRAGLMVTFERALESLWLAFQPILDTRQERVVAYEALLRSREPSLPTPMAVLDAAERLDVVPTVGRRVRELAAEALESVEDEEFLLFVNIHAAELDDGELYRSSNPLRRHARRVVIEVTERASLERVQQVASRARALRQAGFRLAIDDLGAGYAGLTSFVALEPEFVKLDMSLVRGVHDSVTRQRVIHSMVSLCRELNIRTVAEGVETHAELQCLKMLGCDHVQGYLIGRPQAGFVAESVVVP